jgi:hypothetical protein
MHYIVSMLTRWVEAEHVLQSIEEFGAGSLRDADGAIALNVRVSSHWDDARAAPADVSAQKQ